MKKHIPVLEEAANIMSARDKWQYTGAQRPDFAEEPTAGQTSVWDFPRPPKLETVNATLRVFHEQQLVAQTDRGVRVMETAGAPTYYFPPQDVDQSWVEFADMSSICEWKGVAQSINVGPVADAGWRYVRMFPAFVDLFEWPSFYPNKLLCFVDTELVSPQPGGYYGGWVTKDLSGPIKGAANSSHW